MQYTGAELITKLLEAQGIEIVAGIPGGANLPLYNALYKSKIRHILVRHEQAAGFLAQGMTRSTGKPAVCLATSGPGATNLITAIADAKLDSIPIIAITGQVSTALLGTDAFQEVDTYGMTIPITKHNFQVRRAEELLTVIPEAFRIATSGRPGPVLIDVPKDIQMEIIETDLSNQTSLDATPSIINQQELLKCAELINQSVRPLIYFGGGIIHSGAHQELRQLARKNSIPAVSTLMGLGCFAHNDPLFLGMLGMHGAPYTNLALTQCDMILVLGARFDDRATGVVQKFCPQATIIHIDIDNAEIDKIKTSGLNITGDLRTILEYLIPAIEQNERKQWLASIEQLKEENPFIMPEGNDLTHPIQLIRSVSKIIPRDSIICTDVGQHQMWVAQSYPFTSPRTLLTSGGLGTMGFGFPAAIGAALANPEKTIVCFSGDGSFLMNIQELATLADLNLNIKIIIFNNGHLGLVRQQQELFFQGHYIASKFDSSPDFAAIARGFGIESTDLAKAITPLTSLTEILQRSGPHLINAPIRPELNVLPMVPPGKGNHEFIGGDNNGY